MGQQIEKTTLTLFDQMRTLIVSNGQLNKLALRAAFGTSVRDREFGLAFSAARYQLEEEGLFLVPVAKSSGLYKIATAQTVADRAMNKSRFKVMRAVEQRSALLVNAQKHKDLSDDARNVLNREEMVFSRFRQHAERELLRRQRKLPAGL